MNVPEKNPWFQRPDDLNERREIDGQLCVWDDDPVEEGFGQIWISICPVCERGPLNKGVRFCGVDQCVSGIVD